MISFVAYFPTTGHEPGKGASSLATRRQAVHDFVRLRGRLVAEYLDATDPSPRDSAVFCEARRFCREHGAVLLIAGPDGLVMDKLQAPLPRRTPQPATARSPARRGIRPACDRPRFTAAAR